LLPGNGNCFLSLPVIYGRSAAGFSVTFLWGHKPFVIKQVIFSVYLLLVEPIVRFSKPLKQYKELLSKSQIYYSGIVHVNFI
jgi:hypothetical protein